MLPRGVPRLVALLLMLPALQALAGANQWTVRGPYGGRIVDVVYLPDGSTVFAATRTSVYRSVDAGATWAPMREDFGRLGITDLAVDPSNPEGLFVAEPSAGVFRSTDAGVTYSLIRPVATSANVDGPNALAVSTDGATLYHTSTSGRIFRSIDGGATWSERTRISLAVSALAIDPANAQVVYAARSGGLWKSSDGGGSWTELARPDLSSSMLGLLVVEGTPATVWFSDLQGIHSTTTDGASWNTSLPPPGGTLSRDPGNPAVLLTARSDGTVLRLAGGAWTPLAGTFLPFFNPSVLAIAPGNARQMILGSGLGIQRTQDQGTSWSASHSGIAAAAAVSLAAGGGRVYAGTEAATVAYATDEGEWQLLNLAVSPTPDPRLISAVGVHPSDPQRIIVANAGAEVVRTTDGGANWTLATGSIPLTSALRFTFDPLDPSIVYAATFGQTSPPTPDVYVHRSSDGGASFQPASGNLFFPRPQALVVDSHDTQRLFLASAETPNAPPGLFRSLNSGASWDPVGQVGWNTYDVAVDPGDEGRVYAAASSDGLQVSDDAGDTWAPMASFTGFGVPLQCKVDPVSPDTMYVLSVDGLTTPATYYVMRSVDRGQTWERIPNRFDVGWTAQELVLHPTTPGLLFLDVDQRGVHTLRVSPDLRAAIQGHSGNRTTGASATFDVQIENAGPFAATGVVIDITLPAGLQNVSAQVGSEACTVSASAARCTLPILRRDASATARVNYTPATAGALGVQATVSARETDPVGADNTATANATAVTPAPPNPPANGGGGGGGTMNLLELVALLAGLQVRRKAGAST